MALPRRKAGSQAPAHRGGQPRRPVEADNPFTVSEPDVDDDDDLIEDVGGDDDGYDEDPVYNDSRSQADDDFADENDYDDDEEISEPAEQDDEAYVEDPDDEGLGSAELEEEPEPEPSPRRGRRGNPRGGQRGRIRNNRDDGPRGRGRKPMRQEKPSRKSMMSGFSGLMKSGKSKAKPQRNATVEGAAPSSSALLLGVSSSTAGFAIFLFMLGIFLGILHPGSGSLVLVFVLLLALPFIGLFGGVVSLKKNAAHKSAAITAIVMSLVSILTVGVMYMQMDAISNKVMNDITQAVSVVNSRTNSHESSSGSLTDDEDSGSVHSRTGSATSKKSSSTGTKSKSNTSSQNQSDSNDDSDSGSSSSSDDGQLKSE